MVVYWWVSLSALQNLFCYPNDTIFGQQGYTKENEIGIKIKIKTKMEN